MITVGKHVLWSYVSPIEDSDHHASVMIWSPNSKPRIFLKSEFVASDYMFSSNEEHIYIIEQRYLQNTDKYEIRIFKTRIDEEPLEIWSWFEDEWSECSPPTSEEREGFRSIFSDDMNRELRGARFDFVCRFDIEDEVVYRGLVFSVPKL